MMQVLLGDYHHHQQIHYIFILIWSQMLGMWMLGDARQQV